MTVVRAPLPDQQLAFAAQDSGDNDERLLHGP
jgi:hypothetical protein